MELSIIQHAKDKAPRQVTVDELVSQMRSTSWPAGYQPLVVAGAVVEGGLQKKNVRWLTGLAVVKLRIKREELRIRSEEVRGKMEDVRDDPHTRLCWTDQSGGMFVVFEYELNDGFGKEQQLVYRYFRKPVGEEQKEHVDAAMALQVISGNIASKLYPDQVDAAFAALGFEEATIDGMPGYLAVRRKPEEVNALGRLMVLDAAEQKKT